MEIVKMHGCGNDFCLIKADKSLNYSDLAIRLCARKTGVGADGLIVVEQDPLEMIFYNADGTKASMCGNGIRCFARYCVEYGIVKKSPFDVLTQAGVMKIEVVSKKPFLCKVNMGMPIFNNPMIHVSDDTNSFGRLLRVDDYRLTLYSFYMGTVHTVVFVDSLSSKILDSAEKICKNPLFNKQTNVNFVHVLDEENIEVRTFERGVGWTLACGTGACACVVTTYRLGLTKKKVHVQLPMGSLDIEYHKENVTMTGPAVLVFEGHLKEEI